MPIITQYAVQFGPVRPDNGFELDGWWVWDPSVIRDENGFYHLFASRWPKSQPFHPAWLTHSEIIRATSSSLEGPYAFEEVVLPSRGAEYWDGRATHNPKILKWNGGYYLFYIGITYPFKIQEQSIQVDSPEHITAIANQRIGVAFAPCLEGPWERLDEPVLPTRPRTFYSYMTSNPAPLLEEDGSILMAFKSRFYRNRWEMSKMVLGVARAPSPLGPYEVCGDSPLFGATPDFHLEDPAVWRTDDGYRMIAKDMDGNLTSEKGAGALFESADGIHWTSPQESAAHGFEIPVHDAPLLRVGAFERTFPYFENGKMRALLGAVTDQPGGFVNAKRSGLLIVPVRSTVDN